MFHLAMGILSCFLVLSHRQSEFYYYIFMIDLVIKAKGEAQPCKYVFQAFIIE